MSRVESSDSLLFEYGPDYTLDASLAQINCYSIGALSMSEVLLIADVGHFMVSTVRHSSQFGIHTQKIPSTVFDYSILFERPLNILSC